jgi:hypothetical protein
MLRAGTGCAAAICGSDWKSRSSHLLRQKGGGEPPAQEALHHEFRPAGSRRIAESDISNLLLRFKNKKKTLSYTADLSDKIGMDESLDLLAARLAHIPRGALDFVPVPVKARRDGWTAAVQKTFVLCLAAGLGLSGAARAVGRSRQTAYRLRERSDAASFAAAWDRALYFARLRPLPPGTTAWERGVEGILVPILYRGRIVGSRRKACDRTLGRLLTRVHLMRGAAG